MNARRDILAEIVNDLHARLTVAEAAGDCEPPDSDLEFALLLQSRVRWLDFVHEHSGEFESADITNIPNKER